MKNKPCPFCEYKELKNKYWYVAWEPFPVNVGHMKIMPVRHISKLSEISKKEWKALKEIIDKTENYLNSLPNKPDGYNWGINQGKAAGQSIKHLHIHVIPRYKGDVEDPHGGIRNIKSALVEWKSPKAHK